MYLEQELPTDSNQIFTPRETQKIS